MTFLTPTSPLQSLISVVLANAYTHKSTPPPHNDTHTYTHWNTDTHMHPPPQSRAGLLGVEQPAFRVWPWITTASLSDRNHNAQTLFWNENEGIKNNTKVDSYHSNQFGFHGNSEGGALTAVVFMNVIWIGVWRPQATTKGPSAVVGIWEFNHDNSCLNTTVSTTICTRAGRRVTFSHFCPLAKHIYPFYAFIPLETLSFRSFRDKAWQELMDGSEAVALMDGA